MQRDQITLFPEMIDDYIDKNNQIRFIDVFVDNLDLQELGFKYSIPKMGSGRYPYDPYDMLKLYIYGYLNNIRSSRKLEVETHRNIEIMWLIGKLKPDHKTISNFRRDNINCFKNVFRAFTLNCIEQNLFEDKLIAIDGSKFKADNSSYKCFSKTKLLKMIEKIDEKIDEYLAKLETNDDTNDKSEVIDDNLHEKIQKMLKKKNEYLNLYQVLEETGETQIALTDPDSRIMKTSKGMDVCYNVQTVTAGKHNLVVDFEATNDVNDEQLLFHMAAKAKDILGLEEVEALADKGYYNILEIENCIENGIKPYVPSRPVGNSTATEEFHKDNFRYIEDQDIYICPNNQELRFKTNYKDKKGLNMKRYQCKKYNDCPDKSKCTSNKTGRTVRRWKKEELLEDIQEKIKTNPELMRKRSSKIEHVFGTVKRSFGYDYQLLRGLDGVNAEFSLTFLAYNIKRVMNILGTDKLIEAVMKYIWNYFYFNIWAVV